MEPMTGLVRPTGVTTTTSKTLAAFALVATLAACGSDHPAGGGTSATPPHTTASTPTDPGASMTPPHDFPAAQQVTVLRTGGLTGLRVMHVFAADHAPPKGYTSADVAAVLEAAADPALKSETSASPTAPCCDRFVYRITVTYPDATSVTFSVAEGADAPPALETLLGLVS